MDKTFLRNFLIFTIILLLCAGSLSYGLIRGEQELEKTDNKVIQIYGIISEAESLSTRVEAMLSAQRGFLLSGEERFLENYEEKKSAVSENIANLSELTEENRSQLSRLDEIRNYFSEFSKKLEERSKTVDPKLDQKILDDVEIVTDLKNNITRINTAVLNEAYQQLNEQISTLEDKKREYFYTLLIGVIIGTALILVFNGILLSAQARRNKIEESLRETEDRFVLAVEGAQDGIFDWDIKADTIFFSKRYFEMLGYDKGPHYGNSKEVEELLHPEDYKVMWAYLQQYLEGGLSEYTQEYRMKHASGRWVWIQSRAKALFDDKGKPYRMVGAHTDITHVIEEQQRLKQQKEEAEEANRLKSEFLAHMSHEIRTPLTAINGIAEIMNRDQGNLNEKQKQLVSTLNTSTSTLKDLINDILDFSKIESGELELDQEAFNLADVFESVISIMSLRANEKGVSFIFNQDDVKGIDFYGDKKRLRQIIINLVGNALKFTESGGVTVNAYFEDRDNKEFLRIDVSDTGIGISPENFDLIFERFKQADSSVSRKYGGTGLGLPISRNLANLMGGNIFLSSEKGKGSTFSVIIPQLITNQKQMLARDDKFNLKLNDKIRKSLNNKSKILLVEDYAGNIVVIGYILEDLGIDYDVAKTGKEALDMWSQHHYDLLLMDIQMPEMDGFAATSAIRSLEEKKKLPRTPIIGMTAHALVGDKDKCIEAGMDAYLPKPVVESDLKEKIYYFLKDKKKAA